MPLYHTEKKKKKIGAIYALSEVSNLVYLSKYNNLYQYIVIDYDI